MRYSPTCSLLSTSPHPVATHPVASVLPGASPQRSSAVSTPRPTAVVLDLFGTLVAAPSDGERAAAAAQFAKVLRVSPAVAESVLADSWQARHDGRLASTTEIAAHLVARCSTSADRVDELVVLLGRLARVRLQSDATLRQALGELRQDGVRLAVLSDASPDIAEAQDGVRLAVLSDASPDIAEAWDHSDLAPYFDAAVFSSRAGMVKPDRRLFQSVLGSLGVPPHETFYCGDGGGDELAGAERAGIRAVRVERRGGPDSLVFGETAWSGRAIPDVEALPSLLDKWGKW
ncbi:HAD family hydrolase [Streptomyces sp. NPDC002285]